MSNPQAQGSQGAPQPQGQIQLLKADDIAKLQCLNDDQKQKYKPVLQNFWALLQTKPPGSPEHTQARAKLQDWSSKLITKERQFRQELKNQQQQQAQAQQQQQQGQAQNQQAQPNQQGQQGQQQSQSGNEQQQQAAASQAKPQAAPQQQQQQQQQQQGNRPQANQQNPQQPQVNPEILKHIQNFQYYLPPQGPQAGTPEAEHKIKEFKNSYLMALNKQEKSTHRVKAFANMMQQRQKAGQDIPPELINQKQQAEQEYASAKKYVEEFRAKQLQWKNEHEQRAQRQQAAAAAGQQQQTQQSQPSQPQNQPAQPQQNVVKQEPQIKVEGGQQPQPAQQFGNMQQPQQGTPTSATQPRPPPAQQMQQPNQTQNQPFTQPTRPQINPQQANAQAQQQQQQQQTNSPHPQSATSGPPVPLSHQAAVSAAQRSYSNPDPQRTATPMQQVGQGSFHAPGSREREQLNNPKMPIPRSLNVTTPSPVHMGQARPTMNGPTSGAAGQMGQPVIHKFPPFQLEGEGDRVLSKRKLDELVRQVTGGSEDALTPEVEEAILQLADDFVDTVISSACKLSKLRESPQLDIRDLQVVLERNYNIRIPGYASDEVRTVRKLVPAAGWTQKMNAVQAAKVMGGGKTDL